MSNVTSGSPVADNSLVGIIQFNDKNLSEFISSDLIQPSQLMAELPFIPASNGMQHKFLVETGAAGAAFRTVNNGVTNASGTEKEVTAELKYLDCSWNRDVALADGAKDKDLYFEKQSMKALNAGISKAEYSFVQGTAYDAAGPDGLDDLIQDEMILDAKGANGGSHVYMFIKGESDVAGVVGNEGKFNVGEISNSLVVDEAGGKYTVDFQKIAGYMALQVGGKYSAAKAINVASVDDDLLSDLYFKFPADRLTALRNNGVILMSRKCLNDLKKSRTATSVTGAPAPTPTDFEGIKIIVSDAVKDDYAVVTTTTAGTTTPATTTL